MRKFSKRVAMVVPTFEDWIPLHLKMKDLGYECQDVSDRSFPWKAFTDFSDERNVFAYIETTYDLWESEVYEIPTFNPQLFLAVAAMSTGDEFFPGECLLYKHMDSIDFPVKFIEYSGNGQMNILSADGAEWQWVDDFRKATLSELTIHFTQPSVEVKEWEPRYFEEVKARKENQATEIEARFLAKSPHGYICLLENYYENYLNSESFNCCIFDSIRKMPKSLTLTTHEAQKRLSELEGKQVLIKD